MAREMVNAAQPSGLTCINDEQVDGPQSARLEQPLSLLQPGMPGAVRRADARLHGVPAMMARLLFYFLVIGALSSGDAAAQSATPQAVLERAIAVARTIENPGQRSSALSCIAKNQDELRDRLGAAATWREALTAAGGMDSDVVPPDDLSWIVENLAKTGDTAGALAAAKSIQDPRQRTWSLTEIAATQFAAGDRSGANATLQDALIDIRRLDDSWARDSAISDIAATQAEHLGDFDGALATVKGIADAGRAAQALAGIAAAQTRAGQSSAAAATLRVALSSAGAVADVGERVDVLASVVGTLTDADMIDSLGSVADSMLGSGYRGPKLGSASDALAAAGKIDAALAIAKAIEDPDGRNDAMAAIPAALAKQGHVDEAFAMAEEITGSRNRVDAMAALGRVLLDRANAGAAATAFQSARTAADQITDAPRRDQALAQIAVFQARADTYDIDAFFFVLRSALNAIGERSHTERGDIDEESLPTLADVEAAVASAHAISGAQTRLAVLAVIATPLLQTGDREALRIPVREALATVAASPDETATQYIALVQAASRDSAAAVATARLIEAPRQRAEALAIVAWVQASLGELTTAETTLHEALSVPQEVEHQSELLVFLAPVQARSSGIEHALATTDQITNPFERAMALVAIAAGKLPGSFTCNWPLK
jgi:hypothetical protein